MSLDAVKILEINITKTPKSGILKEIQKYLSSAGGNPSPVTRKPSQPLVIVTPNPEQIVYAQGDSRFREILNQADVVLPDGVGVVWASRFLRLPTTSYPLQSIPQTIPGVDFMENLVSMAAKQRVPVALIGGRDGLALKSFECLQKKHPDLYGIALDAPDFSVTPSGFSPVNREAGIVNHGKKYDSTGHDSVFSMQYSNTEDYFHQMATRIIDSHAGMVFVGLGAPKQEYFIELLLMSLRDRSDGEAISPIKKDCRVVPRDGTPRNDNRVVLMSVGGSFDEIAGRLHRAPKWISGLRLKWLWRLLLEPWRFRRQLALVRFVWMVLKKRYTLK